MDCINLSVRWISCNLAQHNLCRLDLANVKTVKAAVSWPHTYWLTLQVANSTSCEKQA